MPELPEVETVRRELAPALTGRTIVEARFRWPRTAATPTAETFARRVRGRRIRGLRRRGKYLILDLDTDEHLIIHLRMTGQLYLRPPEHPPDKHTHVLLYLDSGQVLHFRDQRKFGRFYLVEDERQIVGSLGPEPLSDTWRVEDFAVTLARRRAPIKALLLDQRVVAGLGNIYADEALFLARVHPLRPGNRLTSDEIAHLHRAIRQVLNEALTARGSSMATYIPPSERRGQYQERHRVFRRTGHPCPQCGTPIQRVKVSGRSTHFCPHCQH